jgi:hypothetical protein
MTYWNQSKRAHNKEEKKWFKKKGLSYRDQRKNKRRGAKSG